MRKGSMARRVPCSRSGPLHQYHGQKSKSLTGNVCSSRSSAGQTVDLWSYLRVGGGGVVMYAAPGQERSNSGPMVILLRSVVLA
jgi:hypothetical protein